MQIERPKNGVAAVAASSLDIHSATATTSSDPTTLQNTKKMYLSGGESNPGLLRVVLSNDKQKY